MKGRERGRQRRKKQMKDRAEQGWRRSDGEVNVGREERRRKWRAGTSVREDLFIVMSLLFPTGSPRRHGWRPDLL